MKKVLKSTKNSRPLISFCIGVYNEEAILESNLRKIKLGLNKITNNNYEIIVVENGSTDRTPEILKKIKDKQIKVYYSPEKGLGKALKQAIIVANGRIIALNAIDLPFGFDDLKQALKLLSTYDLVLGSKAHPESKVSKTFKRQLASLFHNVLLRIFFKVKIKDTQGSIYFEKKKLEQLFRLFNAKDSFFHAQIVIYSQLFGLKIIEVPVTLKKEIRPSKYSVYHEGIKTLKMILREYLVYRTINKKDFSIGSE